MAQHLLPDPLKRLSLRPGSRPEPWPGSGSILRTWLRAWPPTWFGTCPPPLGPPNSRLPFLPRGHWRGRPDQPGFELRRITDPWKTSSLGPLPSKTVSVRRSASPISSLPPPARPDRAWGYHGNSWLNLYLLDTNSLSLLLLRGTSP